MGQKLGSLVGKNLSILGSALDYADTGVESRSYLSGIPVQSL